MNLNIKSDREQEIFSHYMDESAAKTDKMFAILLFVQWFAAIIFAYFLSPKTWIGTQSTTHIHVYAAFFLGGLISLFPTILIIKNPGHVINRYVVAIAQMFYSILLIHLTGGRIETHFHIFGSLAFISFYRDYRPLMLATLITTVDHFLRGQFWPESIYSVMYASPLRALEHISWVIFEDIILIFSIKERRSELKIIAKHQSTIERNLFEVEEIVAKRTAELYESNKRIIDQQQKMIYSSKMSALGEMAGGVAHEINTPLSIISMKVDQLNEAFNKDKLDKENLQKGLKLIKKTNERIAHIVKSLNFFSRGGENAPLLRVNFLNIIEDTLSLCTEKFKSSGINIEVIYDDNFNSIEINCRPVEISQVILNLLNNSLDALELNDEKWIKIYLTDLHHSIEISIVDAGNGIPMAIQEKVMQPFFSTKEIGKGTGLGLSISSGLISNHQGSLTLDTESPNTKFVITLPKNI